MTWEERKELIRAYLVDGWSVQVAFRKAGIKKHMYYVEDFNKDAEFRAEVSKYLQRPMRFNEWAAKP